MKKGKIIKLDCTGCIRRRLLDLGLVSGSTIEAVLDSPTKGIRAFNIRGTLIAIRDEDASNIFIEDIVLK